MSEKIYVVPKTDINGQDIVPKNAMLIPFGTRGIQSSTELSIFYNNPNRRNLLVICYERRVK